MVTEGEVSREIVRVADRVRVVGPRLAGRDTPQAAAALAEVRAVLRTLADLAADAEGRPRPAVPELGAHALADQVLVLGQDVLRVAEEASRRGDVAAMTALLNQAQEVLAGLRRSL